MPLQLSETSLSLGMQGDDVARVHGAIEASPFSRLDATPTHYLRIDAEQ